MTYVELLFLVFHAHQIRKLQSSAEKAGTVFHVVKKTQKLKGGAEAVAEITTLAGRPVLSLGLKIPPSVVNPGAEADKMANLFFFKGAYEALPVCMLDDGTRLYAYISFAIPTQREATDHVKARIGHDPAAPTPAGAERTETYVAGDQRGDEQPK